MLWPKNKWKFIFGCLMLTGVVHHFIHRNTGNDWLGHDGMWIFWLLGSGFWFFSAYRQPAQPRP